MKKIALLAAVVAGVLFAIKRSKDAKAEAELWREATAPSGGPTGAMNVNGAGPAATSSRADAARNN
ncbi:DLW-39 family protein [Haloechinothrix sp. LS1_15]|uniref:DLW-39 family protein n=1 Tax=Haloechinothrix sp. LS1_15 TaxID=2652248 RepID=UPI002947F5AB|nr:DLW-39 family protein [Haloechinothrix sp. LS1_15]MDV6010959.1 hypothetical protein [Haloechinothrix sp. LS1_15]